MIRQAKHYGRQLALAGLVLLGGGQQAAARGHADDSRHEVALSYGGGSTSTWASVGQAVGDALASGLVSGGSFRYDNSSWFGSLSAEYFYRVRPALGVGAVASFSQDNDDFLENSTKAGDRTTTFWTLMPAVKWNYLRRDYFGMYMKLAVGYTFMHTTEDYKDKKFTTDDGFFNTQLTLLGLEGGTPRLRLFGELGFGEQGIALAGLRYRF